KAPRTAASPGTSASTPTPPLSTVLGQPPGGSTAWLLSEVALVNPALRMSPFMFPLSVEAPHETLGGPITPSAPPESGRPAGSPGRSRRSGLDPRWPAGSDEPAQTPREP
uniref:Uncharacterized protein n=1 Tax=Mustela putorius furo TaxID=9669 RepID=M3XYA8_MUSPF